MADLPRNTGHSASGVAVDDSVHESGVPAWLAARRARSSSSTLSSPPESDAELDSGIEFASVSESESDVDLPVDEQDSSPALPVPSAGVPAQSGSSLGQPSSPPLNFEAGSRIRSRRETIVQKFLNGPEDNSFKGQVLRWIKSATVTALTVSLLVHTGILSALAFVVFQSASINQAGGIVGTIGEPGGGGDDLSQLDIDTSLPVESSKDASPVEFTDVSQVMDKITFNPGESIRGGKGSGNGNGSGGEGGTGDIIGVAGPNIPKYAVTKGSFSAWTDPRDPDPGKNYEIVIQFRLPSNVRVYKGSDLSGMVSGTDGYKQAIKFSRTESFPVQDGNVQVRIRVPGGERLIRDTIRIESKLLHEKQVIEIEF